MQMRFGKIRIQPDRFPKLTYRIIPVFLLRFQRSQGVMQHRIVECASQSALRLRDRKFSLVSGGKRPYVEDRHARWQWGGGALFERSKKRKRFFVIARLLVRHREIHLCGAIAGFERERAPKFADCLLKLTELLEHRAQGAVSLGDIRRQPNDFLELYFGGGQIASLFRGVTRMKSHVCGSELLRVVRGRQTRCKNNADRQSARELVEGSTAAKSHRRLS